jgi:hypothetical protein
VQRLFSAWDALYTYMGAHGEELIFQTTSDAPLGRVIGVDAREPSKRHLIVPEGATALEEASYVGGRGSRASMAKAIRARRSFPTPTT